MTVATMEYIRKALSFLIDSFRIWSSGVLSNWRFKSIYVHHKTPVPTKWKKKKKKKKKQLCLEPNST
jgi:hypothetical protein